MSRNVRQHPPTTPVKIKVSKRRASDASSSLDLSDEEGYSDLDNITSDEDDEEDVEAAEEEHILHSSPQPNEEGEQGDDEAGDDDDEDEDEDDDDDDDDDNDAVESTSWDGCPSDVDDLNRDETDTLSLGNDSAVERRVRFDVPESSDGDSTETDEDVVDPNFFPDIFVPQSSLDPSFRREIERDQDDDDNDSNSGFWDFHSHDFPSYNTNDSPFDDNASTDIEAVLRAIQEDDSTPVATPMTSQENPTAQSSRVPSPEMIDEESSLDGYQTDGDTTEEEDEPRPVRPKTQREQAEDASDSEAVTIIRPRRGQPRVGRFTLDNPRKKPIAIVNPKTGKMMIFTPQGGRGRGLDLSPEQFNFQWFETEAETSPMVNSGNMMMSAMVSSNTFGDFMNTQAVGPEEAFFSLPSDVHFFEDSPNEDGQEDEEKHLELEDFIDFDDFAGLSGDDEGLADNDDPILCTPGSVGRPLTASSDMTSLLDHFETNADIVGAFRRDQANHQLISRSKATRESLAFSGPYYEGTLRGIKDGRIASTNVPISPLRKQRRATDAASSPLASINQKRKASSQQDWGHKRQRSIPDVNVLSI